jgi:tRNA threonylcarbamoyladenosine biosynthesis protein TsaB
MLAALDTSAAQAVFAVADADGSVRCQLRIDAVGRRSAGLLPAIQAALTDIGTTLADLDHWTVGMGPGSFTGIRVGAALASGICQATGARCRGVPSSLAMVAAAAADSPRLTALHDGRRGELLISPYRLQAGAWQPAADPSPVVAADLTLAVDAAAVMLATDPALPLVPDAVRKRLHVLDSIDASCLLSPRGWPWPDADERAAGSLQPVYIRPAASVAPAKRRQQ